MKIYDFVGRRKIWFGISIALMVIALVATFFPGVKLDIQFSGGTIITYSFTGEVDKSAFTSTVESALTGRQVSLQEQQDMNTGNTQYVVTLSERTGISPDEQIAVNEALAQAFPDNQVILYIAYRFRKMNGWSAGVISVMALLHDVIIAYAAFVICGFPLNDSFIAVVLTILGYSINNTIIIYDRIRENRRLLPQRTSYAELVNTSVTQSLGRSINTTVSTVIAVACVCALSLIYHVSSILTFSLPLLVGMFAGFFSSVFIAGPLWALWQEHKAAQRHAA